MKAVSGISLDVLEGETLGLVGESGCGKSTTGRAILQLPAADQRAVSCFEGEDLTKLKGSRAARGPPPHAADLPGPDLVAEPPAPGRRHRRRAAAHLEAAARDAEQQAKVDEVLERRRARPRVAGPKRPHQFSGGQCQRISIARSLVLDPKLIICDEPVSALDVSVQAQILNLLEDMKARYGLTLVFIAHDLAVVKNVSDRVAVMYLGKLCEVAHARRAVRPARPTRTPRRCCRPSRCPTRTSSRGHSDRAAAATRPRRSTRRRAAGSAPAARGRRERCAEEEPVLRPGPPRRQPTRGDHVVACHHPLVEAARRPTPPTVAGDRRSRADAHEHRGGR